MSPPDLYYPAGAPSKGKYVPDLYKLPNMRPGKLLTFLLHQEPGAKNIRNLVESY